MAIKFNCPHCQKALNVKDHLAGRRAQCPGCKKVLTVPAPAPTAPAADVEALAAAALADEPPPPEETREPENVEFVCEYCDEKVAVNVELAGKRAQCPKCKNIVRVPALEKKQPKDWRKVETRLPAGARRDVGPAPEGTWGTDTVGTVSRQALVEAQAIKTVREPWTWGRRIKWATAALVLVGLVGATVWTVTGRMALARESNALTAALQAADGKGLSPEAASEVYRLAGRYYFRAHNLEQARTQLEKAAAVLRQSQPTSPGEHDLAAIDAALEQIDLGGDKTEIDAATRIKWDDALNLARQTLQQTLQTPEGRAEAVRQVVRRLLGKGQANRVAPVAAWFSEDGAELAAVVGLEFLRAGQKDQAETFAGDAQQKYASLAPRTQPNQPKPAAPPAPPSLVALWIALGKLQQAEALAPPAGPSAAPPASVLAGYAEGWARANNLEAARTVVRSARAPQEQLQVLVALCYGAAEADQAAAAKPDLEEALRVADAEVKNPRVPSWTLWRLARTAEKAGLTQQSQALVKIIPDAGLRGRIQLEQLRAQLATSKSPVGDSAASSVDKDTPAFGLAAAAVAYHDAHLGAGSAVQTSVNGLDEKVRPFGQAGLALGLQAVREKVSETAD